MDLEIVSCFLLETISFSWLNWFIIIGFILFFPSFYITSNFKVFWLGFKGFFFFTNFNIVIFNIL